MDIILKNVLPFPIKELDYSKSEIWNKNLLEFKKSKKYHIKAFSGKGKTTLLSTIYGIRKDYSGELLIDNQNIKNIVFSDLRKNALSYVFQGLDLFDELTVWENIQVKNRLTKNKTDDEILNLLNKLEISTLKERITKTLSYGQKQRVAIIRALCQPFKWILLDEPFSHLDKENVNRAFSVIADECKKNQAGMILTSLSVDYNYKFDYSLNL